MTRRQFISGCMVCGLLPAFVQAEPPVPSDMRIGLARSMFSFVPETVFPVLARPFRKLIQNQTGLAGNYRLVADCSALADEIDAGTTHMGVFNGFEFAWLKARHPNLNPLAVAVGREKRPTAVLVVKKDSPVRKPEELNGQAVVLSKDAKCFCRLYLERFGPKADTSVLKTTSQKLAEPPFSANDALDGVIDGKYAATVVDGGSLIQFKESMPERGAWLRVVATSEPFPSAVIAYKRGSIPARLAAQLTNILVTAHTTQTGADMMRTWRMRRFDAVPGDYDQQLADCLKTYPPPAASK